MSARDKSPKNNKTKSTKRKNTTKKKQEPQNFSSAMELSNIEKHTNLILGLLLVIIALLAILAMGSYIATGLPDQSLLSSLEPDTWFQQGSKLANICGAIGAIVSYLLISVGFGWSSVLIPIFLGIIGLRLMFPDFHAKLWKWFFGFLFTMIWLSVLLATVQQSFEINQFVSMGGAFGNFCATSLRNMTGVPGLVCMLILVGVGVLSYIGKSRRVSRWIEKVFYPVKKATFIVTNHEMVAASADGDAQASDEQKPDEGNYDIKTEFDENQNATVTFANKQEEEPVSPEPEPSVEVPVEEVVTVKSEPTVAEQPKTQPNEPKKEKTPKAKLTVEEKHKQKLLEEESSGRALPKTPINPLEPFTKYKYPTLSLLKVYPDDDKPAIDKEELARNNDRIQEVLSNFGIRIKEVRATVGPTVTLYEIIPAEGVRINKIRNLEDDIALSLAALGVRIIAPIPGRGTIGIEVPNKQAKIVSMHSILNSKEYKETKMQLPIALGKTITNEVFMADLAKIPHLLVAGATGQGKSVGLNAIITSLLYKKHPNELKIVLIDPKKVEFGIYKPIANHFMAALPENEDSPVITDVTKVVRTLNSLCTEMDNRFRLLQKAATKNIVEYNRKFCDRKLKLTDGHDFMPYLVIIIDEFGDLIMTAGKEVERPIARIAQLGRAAGMHMVIATQRPSVKVITGNIKANFPGRMAFRVMSHIDSSTILDQKGADQLVGRGDMLFLNGLFPTRVQCAFVDTPEVEEICAYIQNQLGPTEPMTLPEPVVESGEDGGEVGGGKIAKLDALFDQVARHIVTNQQASTSSIQRDFEVGFNRAGRIMNQLQQAGIVGPPQGAKPRDVLIVDPVALEEKLRELHE